MTNFIKLIGALLFLSSFNFISDDNPKNIIGRTQKQIMEFIDQNNVSNDFFLLEVGYDTTKIKEFINSAISTRIFIIKNINDRTPIQSDTPNYQFSIDETVVVFTLSNVDRNKQDIQLKVVLDKDKKIIKYISEKSCPFNSLGLSVKTTDLALNYAISKIPQALPDFYIVYLNNKGEFSPNNLYIKSINGNRKGWESITKLNSRNRIFYKNINQINKQFKYIKTDNVNVLNSSPF